MEVGPSLLAGGGGGGTCLWQQVPGAPGKDGEKLCARSSGRTGPWGPRSPLWLQPLPS